MNLVKADPDVWMRSATSAYGHYFDYIFFYVDDCLCISENPKPALLQIDKYFPIKPASVGPPKTYLGGGSIIDTTSKWRPCVGVQIITICA